MPMVIMLAGTERYRPEAFPHEVSRRRYSIDRSAGISAQFIKSSRDRIAPCFGTMSYAHYDSMSLAHAPYQATIHSRWYGRPGCAI